MSEKGKIKTVSGVVQLKQQQKLTKLSKEEVLKEKIEAGEWQKLSLCRAFAERTPEGQILAMRDAMSNRTDQMRSNLNRLLNIGQRTAYINLLEKVKDLERMRDEMINNFYSKGVMPKIMKESKGKRYF